MNQRGRSESRYPIPEMPDVPSGGTQKGMSRYLARFFSIYENLSPETFESFSKVNIDEKPNLLPLSKKEYLQKCNAVFRELTMHDSPAGLFATAQQEDFCNEELLSSLELYLTALDEKVYMSVDNSRAILGLRDNYVRTEMRRIHERPGDLIPMVIKLRMAYNEMWTKLSILTQQRNEVESELALLRDDHALQLGKALRLRHSTQCLGKKIVSMNAENADLKLKVQEKDELEARVAELELENSHLRASLTPSQQTSQTAQANQSGANSSVNGNTSGNSGGTSGGNTGGNAGSTVGFQQMSPDDKISCLYSELSKLKFAEMQTEIESDDPAMKLRQCLNLISLGNSANQQRQISLLNAFMNQYKSRERELMTQIAKLNQENEIYAARISTLKKKIEDKDTQLEDMDNRNLSLIMTLKDVRASLRMQVANANVVNKAAVNNAANDGSDDEFQEAKEGDEGENPTGPTHGNTGTAGTTASNPQSNMPEMPSLGALHKTDNPSKVALYHIALAEESIMKDYLTKAANSAKFNGQSFQVNDTVTFLARQTSSMFKLLKRSPALRSAFMQFIDVCECADARSASEGGGTETNEIAGGGPVIDEETVEQMLLSLSQFTQSL